MQPPGIDPRYHLHEQIGQGSMARVYRATDQKEERPVALKVFSPGVPISEEVATIARLHHRNVVGLFDYSGPGHSPAFIVMELVDGTDLETLLKRGGPLPPEVGVTLLGYVAEALHHCHQEGILHGDLKPANLMLEAATGRMVLMDFGIARPLGAPSDPAAPLWGTPEFLSPEQLLKGPLSPATDIFAFGSLAYTLLCGRSPFESDSPVEVLRRIIDVEYTPATHQNPALPPEVDPFLLRCLLADPAARASAEDLRAHLHGILSDRGEEASEDTIRTWLDQRREDAPEGAPLKAD